MGIQRIHSYLFALFIYSKIWVLFGQDAQLAFDFLSSEAHISINPYEKQVTGTVTFQIEALDVSDSLLIDAVDMIFSEVKVNGEIISTVNNGKHLRINNSFRANIIYEVSLKYLAKPKRAMYFLNWDRDEGPRQVWTQGQGKNNSNWIPSLDNSSDKMIWDLFIQCEKPYDVLSNGILLGVEQASSYKTWHYRLDSPISSYLLAIAIGNYDNAVQEDSHGHKIQLYYYPWQAALLPFTYEHTTSLMEFMEKEVGTPYPYGVYRMVPVQDFLYAGMENASCTLYSDTYVVDSIARWDRPFLNVNAHELAHQWFGNLVTAAKPEDHWLQEGLATFFSYKTQAKFYGIEHFYALLYQSIFQLDMLNQNGGEPLRNGRASSLTYYERGAWASFILQEMLGETIFRKAVKQYLFQYKERSASTADFLTVMEESSGIELDIYREKWLESPIFPTNEALNLLIEKSNFIKTLELIRLQPDTPLDLISFWLQIEEPEESEIRKLLAQSFINKVLQVDDANRIETLKAILALNDRWLNQAAVRAIEEIPLELQSDIEKFLFAPSYQTQEVTFWKLWLQFPEKRIGYLDLMRDAKGFNDLNLRLLWLLLAISTPDYLENDKPMYYQELSNYTAPSWAIDIRMNAFEMLGFLNLFSDQNLLDLLDACMHHTWSHAQRARALLMQLEEKSDLKTRLEQLWPVMNDKQKEYYQRIKKE